ncbi:MAG: anti-sigma factor family protein [Pyrinomonadaceae bacterium]
MNSCLDEGILQTYLDGELSPDASHKAAAHLAVCDACSALLAEAAEQWSFFTAQAGPALTPATVPSERLRERIEAEVATLEETRPVYAGVERESRLSAWLGGLFASLNFVPARSAAFASLLVALLLSIVFIASRPDRDKEAEDSIATVIPQASPFRTPEVLTPSETPSDVTVKSPTSDNAPSRPAIVNAVSKPGPIRKVNARRPAGNKPLTPDAPVLLPGERTYLTAIASLTTTIEARGPESLPPTLRADYERNLAVVDQAILASRVAARRNPQDVDAQDFLRTAYQSKVELLSTVAGQAQLASVRD